MRSLLLLILALPQTALAADVSVGAALGTTIDLPDATSADHTAFGPGGSLLIPVRVELVPGAFVRAALRADVATGSDRVSWAATRGADSVRIAADDHWAMLTAGSLILGLEGRVPEDWPIIPMVGAGLGGAFVGTWHSFGRAEGGADTSFLLDPEQHDLQDPNNRDPYATSFTPIVDMYLGAVVPVGDALEIPIEVGYSVAFIPAATLQTAPPDIDAQRDAFGWNALRIHVGASYTF